MCSLKIKDFLIATQAALLTFSILGKYFVKMVVALCRCSVSLTR